MDPHGYGLDEFVDLDPMDLDPGGLGWMWTQRIGKRRIHTTDLGLGDPLTGPGSNVAALRIWDPGAHLPARHGFGSGDPFTAQKNYRGPYNVDVVNRKTTPRWPNTVSCSLRCPTEPSCICIYIYIYMHQAWHLMFAMWLHCCPTTVWSLVWPFTWHTIMFAVWPYQTCYM